MRIQEVLYWAPGIPFDKVDFIRGDLPALVQARIADVYLEPAYLCIGQGQAFAAGLVLVAAIDAFARIAIGGKHKSRFTALVNSLPSFAGDGLADRFHDDFRNGLVHEARIKRGGQFCLEIGATVSEHDGVLLVNPARLADEIAGALEGFIENLGKDEKRQKEIGSFLKSDFAADLDFCQRR